MHKETYSQSFKEEAIRKLVMRGSRTIAEVAQELNVPYHSAKNWLRKSKMAHYKQTSTHEKRPQDWNLEERLQALLDTGAFSPEALNAWCRERGLFAHQLAAWKAAFCQPARGAGEAAEIRQLKQTLAATERELARKEKALSEAAALLILQKKCQALWEDEDK